MIVLAPPRLSMMTCWPKRSVSLAATPRATISVVPPGGYGTTKRTGLVGYDAADWACAGADAVKKSAGSTHANDRLFFIVILIVKRSYGVLIVVLGTRLPGRQRLR